MLGYPVVLFLPTVYAVETGLALATIGVVLTVARLWDVVIDPAIGWLSDRTLQRTGRRRSWVALALPVVMGATWFLFQPAPGLGWAYLLFWSMLAYSGWAMLQIAHQAWGAELSRDYDERNRITAAREIPTVLGIVAATGLPAMLAQFGLVGARSPEAAALAALAWFVPPALAILAVSLIVVVPEPRRDAAGSAIGWRAGLALIRDNRPFRRLMASYVFNALGNTVPATLFLMFVTYRLEMPDAAGAFLLIYFLCAVAGVPLWTALARRRGKHRSWSAAIVLSCVVFAFVPLLGPGDLWPYVAVLVINGIAFGADLVLPGSMQADVVDVDTAAGGPGRTGLFFALWAMATKLALALAPGIAFVALDVAGFAAGPGNAPGALLTLALLYAWAPIGFKLIAVALLRGYDLTADAQAELAARIAARDAAR
ncbi:MAG: MFS transporter [Alphaproteobacteria bacterium]|nr:MFS transporter [Alphaproteobacteria bacterium]